MGELPLYKFFICHARSKTNANAHTATMFRCTLYSRLPTTTDYHPHLRATTAFTSGSPWVQLSLARPYSRRLFLTATATCYFYISYTLHQLHHAPNRQSIAINYHH